MTRKRGYVVSLCRGYYLGPNRVRVVTPEQAKVFTTCGHALRAAKEMGGKVIMVTVKLSLDEGAADD
jgi:hypothetical protein